MSRICSEDNCNERYYTRGFCKKHYQAWYYRQNIGYYVDYRQLHKEQINIRNKQYMVGYRQRNKAKIPNYNNNRRQIHLVE